MHVADRTSQTSSPWPGRLGAWTLVAAVPLVLFGGSVTTMRAGMAENGWLEPDGFLLWMYPWAMRVRDAGVFVEHHHRELGSLVGLLSIATVVATFLRDARWSARLLALGGLLAVSGQGVVGGLRVLENSPQLAFLHGALAQAVVSLLVLVAVVLDSRWRDARRLAAGASAPAARWLVLTFLLVFGQAVLGAWLRHGHTPLALVLHASFALAAAGAVWAASTALLRGAQAAGDGAPAAAAVLLKQGRRLRWILLLQLVLGMGAVIAIYALSGGMEAQRIHPSELVFATAHVAVGALLLGALVSAAAWTARLAPRRTEAANPARLVLGEAEGGVA